jgi:hypothetical protein
MTPPANAVTRSARRSASRSARSPGARARRVSGPARPGVTVGASAVAAVALPAPAIKLPGKRPLRPLVPAPSRRTPKRSQATTEAPGVVLRVSDRLGRVSSSALLDRLIRGRLWIALIAFALIGIVAMQLLVLELNTSVGRSLQREALLQRENAEIGIEDSVASAGERVESEAAARGMTMAVPGSLHFVAASVADIGRAAAALAAATRTSGSSGQTSSGASEGEATASSTAAGETASETDTNTSGSTTTDETEASSADAAPSQEATAATSSPEASATVAPSQQATAAATPTAAPAPTAPAGSTGGTQVGAGG